MPTQADRRLLAFQALSDLTRFRVVRVLAATDARGSVSALAQAFGMPPSKVSKHVGLLVGAGLIVATKEGRRVWLALATSDLEHLISAVLATEDQDGTFAADLKLFRALTEMD